MRWTLTSYLEWRTKEAPTNPKVLLFFNVLFAFAAGAELIYELEEGSRSPLGIILGCFMVVFWLAMSLECSYLLLRAVQQCQPRKGIEQ